MTSKAFSVLALFAAMTVAFLAGRGTLGPRLEAQGINPSSGNRAGLPTPSLPTAPPGTTTAGGNDVLMYADGNGVAASSNAASSNNGILAVTGSYGVGTSVLYVIDTENQQLAVYEARGGSRSMRRLTLVGARRIDLDLQLRGYNDESDYQYAALEKMFAGRGANAPGPDITRTIDASGERR